MDSEKVSDSALLDSPIPLELYSLAGWKEVPIRENGEPLVPLGPFSGSDEIFTHAIYFGEKKDSPYPSGSLEGSLVTMFVRQEVVRQLKRAQALLPSGMHLLVFDAYRTLQVQQSLYDVYLNELKKIHPDWTDDQLSVDTQRYVSVPSTDSNRPSPHNTGGAVDVAIFQLPEEVEIDVQRINNELATLENKDWEEAYRLEMRKIGLIEANMQLLNFGTRFDYGGVEASLNYFEKLATKRSLTAEEQEAQSNRRLLYNTMVNVGFEPYEDEWWHFNSKKSQMGAKVAGLDHAEYGPMQLSPENSAHEKMRRDHWTGSVIISNHDFGSKLGLPLSPAMRAAQAGVSEVGDIRNTQSPCAEVITPQKPT
ncbi:MAG: M15 family metallopeptidase [Candidatus Daviesbacteria bacterium]|nr:M15 family metallopeptidase [Candidatus Daviesbacteria bacterium]